MATWSPISGVMSQYDKSAAAGSGPASGYYLKFYDITNTAISMASASDGSGLLVKAQLDSSGYPVNGSADRFIPFIDQDYRPALYTNATDADADTIANADWFPGTTPQGAILSSTAFPKNFDTMDNAVASTTVVLNDVLLIADQADTHWDAVDSATVTENDFNPLQGPGAISYVLRKFGSIKVPWLTANTGAANKLILENIIASLPQFARPMLLTLPAGIYDVEPLIDFGINGIITRLQGGGKYVTQINVPAGASASYLFGAPDTTNIEYVKYSGMAIIGNARIDSAIRYADGNHNEYTDLLINSTTADALYLGGYSNDITFCDIFSNTGSAINLNGTLNNVNVFSNKIYANSGIGVSATPGGPDAGLSINITHNAIEANAVAGVMAFGLKSPNIDHNYFERNAATGYTYTVPETITIKADIHLLAATSFSLDNIEINSCKSASVTNNITQPNGAAGVGTADMDGFVFSTMPNNLTIENNDTFLASLMDNILVLYQNRAYSSIVGEVNIERNTVNAVGYIGTFSTTEHLATTHLINDNSNDSLTNYSEKSWSAWGSLDGTTGTLIRSGNKFNNIHSAGLTTGDKKHGNTIDLTIHQELRGKWVWFGMWTNDQGDSTGIQIFIDDETSLGVAPAGGLSTWQFQSTLQYIDPAATTLTYGFKLIGTSSAGQLVNNPVLAVVGNKYDDFPNDIAIRELSAAIPTVGTYDDNEVVWNSAAAVGAPAAWSCTTAGDLAGAGVLTAWANL